MSIPRPNGSGATDRVTVPCGKCPECLANKRSQWSFRLSQELKYTEFNSFFITLTYDDFHLPFAVPEIGSNMVGSPTLVKSDLQLFFKRLRKKLATNIRYYAVGEYGTRTSRPHYHAIVFNIDLDMVAFHDQVLKAWKQGQIHIGSVEPASIHYVTKYCITHVKNNHDSRCRAKEFTLMSNKPGLGSKYVVQHERWHHADKSRMYAVTEGGFKVGLPRYYRDKLYSRSTLKRNAKKSELLREQKLSSSFAAYVSKGLTPSDFYSLELDNKEKLYSKQSIVSQKDKF